LSNPIALQNLLSAKRICLHLNSSDKHSVLAELVDILDRAGKLRDRNAFLQAIEEREATGSTGLEQGVAIPHARSDAVLEAAVVFGIARNGIDFGALDGQPSRFFLMIAEPLEGESAHLEILASACCHLNEEKCRQQLLQAGSAAEIIELFSSVETGAPGADEPDQPHEEAETPLMIAAVTSCPVGVSHTYMAAERLREAARHMGIKLLVETHGSVGVKGRLTADDIAHAKAVILAVDRKVDTRRFADKPVIEAWVTDAINDPEKLIKKALSEQADKSTDISTGGDRSGVANVILDLYRHIMYGISTILPFVIAGGVLISLSSMIGNGETEAAGTISGHIAAWMQLLGGTQGAFGLLATVLAGFIGRSIAGRTALMPSMVGGYLLGQAQAGLLGGIVAGLLGGYGLLAISRLLRCIPRGLETIKATLLFPLLGLTLCGGMAWLLMSPMETLNSSIARWLFAMETLDRLLLGVSLGAMMAIDLGGPINKIAYTFGIIGIGMGNYLPAAATMAGGMVPPLGIGLATLVFGRRYNQIEHRQGRSCFLKGTCFVTEGVISFARENPWRVIPPCMLGAITASALSMVFRCELLVPHGGIFVIPLVKHWPQYCLAITGGVLLTAVLAGLLKKSGEIESKAQTGNLGEKHYR